MVQFFLKRILFPLILWFLVVALSTTLIPEEYAPLRPLPAMLFLIVLVYWWLTGLARWLVRRWRWVTVAYLLTNLAVAFVLMSGFLTASYILTSYEQPSYFQQVSTITGLVGLIVGSGWLLWSIIHLLRKGQRQRSKSIWWRLLSAWLDAADAPATKPSSAKPKATKRQKAEAEAKRTPPLSPAQASRPASKPLFTQMGAGVATETVPGVAIPPRTSMPRPTTPRRVGNDPQEFVRQAQEWALRQEYVGNPVSFATDFPTYNQMSFEQEQWYFHWRTQLRQGNFLATDLSYLYVYVYELLNVVGVNSPADGRDRLVNFWHFYRELQPNLDNYVVDWVADFGVLHNLSESTLAWYAQALSVGALNKNMEILQLEAWHQQGRDYNALPATALYTLAGYTTEQNKFYQAYQNELALDDALKRGVEVIDQYVQASQRLSLYELHLPMPTQTVVRLPLQGAVHRYPSTPIVIARVRPWRSEEPLKGDLKSILRYTENILRTQAAYKSKLRGVTVPPAWATVLDQAFVKAPPKRVVSIDLEGAAALQRESDELRQRLLDAGEVTADASVAEEAVPPVIDSTIPASVPSIQRPNDAPAGLLTDLPALAAIMGNATSEATDLLRVLRTFQWQTKPANLKTVDNNQFVSLIFDRINERAIGELGDALIFVEGEDWVVAEDYQDEIAYLLDHPDFALNLIANLATREGVPVEVRATSSKEPSTVALNSVTANVEQHDLIPTGWEECVRQMQPLSWATLAIVLEQGPGEQDKTMPKLEALARSHYVTASQLIDRTNEVGLASVGDNLIDVATTPPQVIDEYIEPLRALLLWAKDHHQIEGLS